jgi:hypothetical protein
VTPAIDASLTQRCHQLGHELGTLNHGHPGDASFLECVSEGMQQVGLPRTGATDDHQRVVFLAGRCCGLTNRLDYRARTVALGKAAQGKAE